MYNNMWPRVILESYRYLDRMAKALDDCVDSCVKAGFRCYEENTYDLMEKMIDYIYRKQGLVNLKVLFDKVLKEIDRESSELLINKHIKKMKFSDIAAKNGISLRTVFRRYDTALSRCSSCLSRMGFTCERLDADYSDDPFVGRMKERLEKRLANMAKTDKQKSIRPEPEIFALPPQSQITVDIPIRKISRSTTGVAAW